jgi:hypothetical protein
MLRIRSLIAVVVVLACAPASAAAQAPDLDDFRWRAGATDLPGRVEALAQRMPRASLGDVLASANRPATANGPCDAAAFPGKPAGTRWYCFDPSDTGSVERPDAVEWIPQGVDVAADALLVSWYDKRTAPAKGVRVSLLDPRTNTYRHALLAYPSTDASYGIVDVHAGGIARVGDRLYVADTRRGVRVFDLRQIFKVSNTSDKTKVGRDGDTFYAFGYQYVLPQVGAWVNNGPDNDGDFTCDTNGPPKYSSVAVDGDALVTSEYCDSGALGRVARWPLNGTDPAPSADGLVHATKALRLPAHNVQGAVSAGGTYYLSRSRGAGTNGQLIPANGELEPAPARAAGIGPEDLSVFGDEVWTVTEHAGRRMLYGVPR